MDVAHTFELAFGISERNNPEIIFIIEDHHLPEFEERIETLSHDEGKSTDKYLGEHACAFTMPTSDLFGKTRFGYGDCGYVREKDGKVEYHVELDAGPRVQFATLTIHVLTWALAVPFELPPRTNQLQSIILYTRSDTEGMGGYWHAVNGYVHQPLNEWLRDYAKENEDSDSSGVVSVPEAVLDAMIATWNATCIDSWKEFGTRRDIMGMIRMNGAFIFHCFGNACDMGVYPDGISPGIEMRNLQCHNLDGPVQQLTLLAGLAKLCQLAREQSPRPARLEALRFPCCVAGRFLFN